MEFLDISSATNEVVTLKRGILKSFDMRLKTVTATPAEANSTDPSRKKTFYHAQVLRISRVIFPHYE